MEQQRNKQAARTKPEQKKKVMRKCNLSFQLKMSSRTNRHNYHFGGWSSERIKIIWRSKTHNMWTLCAFQDYQCKNRYELNSYFVPIYERLMFCFAFSADSKFIILCSRKCKCRNFSTFIFYPFLSVLFLVIIFLFCANKCGSLLVVDTKTS